MISSIRKLISALLSRVLRSQPEHQPDGLEKLIRDAQDKLRSKP